MLMLGLGAWLGAWAGGCGRQERVIEITSEPAGAVVWLNDRELGRTPVQTEFLFFGVYDVRLALEGYEPVVTSREAALLERARALRAREQEEPKSD